MDERHLLGTCFCTWEAPTLVSQSVQVTPQGGGGGWGSAGRQLTGFLITICRVIFLRKPLS